MNWELFQNSLLLSGSVTALATVSGALAGLGTLTLPRSLARGFLFMLVIAAALPPFLAANTWLRLLGYNGALRPALDVNILSFGGAVWTMTLMFAPLAALLAWSAWRGLDRNLLEVAPELRGLRLLRHVLLPAARESLILASVLIFVLAFNQFSVPALYQTKVYPVSLWINFNTTFDYSAALNAAVPLLAVPAIGLLLARRHPVRWQVALSPASAAQLRQALGTALTTTVRLVALSVTFLACLPLLDLLTSAETFRELRSAASTNGNAAWNSFALAAAAATAVVVLGIVTARWRVGGAGWIIFFAPGVLLGIAMIWLFNRPQTNWFYQSIALCLVALTLRYFAPAWHGVRRAMLNRSHSLHEIAKLSGAPRWQQFRHAILPQVGPAIAATWFIIYLLTLWDVETLALIVPPGGETLSWRVFNMLHYGHTGQVNAISLMLLGLAIAPLLAWALFRMARSRLAGISALGLMLIASGCSKLPSNQSRVESAVFQSVQVIGARGAGAGQFNKPRALALDRDDNLYVVDLTGRVQKFSPEGEYLLAWQMPQTDKGKPKGMVMDADGNVIVIEPHYSRINHFNPEANLVKQWGDHGTNAGQLYFPRAVAVTRSGGMWISEYGFVERVQFFSRDATSCSVSFGVRGKGPGEFDRPEGVGVGRNDELYVADSCNHRVQMFNAKGEFLHEFGGAGTAPGQMSYPYDVRVDFEGRVYVCEFGNSRIQIFDEKHQSVEIIGGLGNDIGKFHNPWSIAIDSRGNLYVADSGNHRVQKFTRHGGSFAVAPALKEPRG